MMLKLREKEELIGYLVIKQKMERYFGRFSKKHINENI